MRYMRYSIDFIGNNRVTGNALKLNEINAVTHVTHVTQKKSGREKMRIYPASKSKHWPFWQSLRSAGIPIASSWIDAPFNRDGTEPPNWALHWTKCIDEAAAADIVLMFAQEGENQNGALIEVGAALAAGKRVYLVSPHEWSWRHHPECSSI